MSDLFDSVTPAVEPIMGGVTLLTRFAHRDILLPEIHRVAVQAAFRHMQTPGGRRMSAAMTNCGPLGWVSDSQGYRYQQTDPLTRQPWPPMPDPFLDLAQRAAEACGFGSFTPDACLINRYASGAQMGAHQDKDEADFSQPIVSVSLGRPANFLVYGDTRSGKPRSIPLRDGDVLVFGSEARLMYHGVRKPSAGPEEYGEYRFNLTFRRAR